MADFVSQLNGSEMDNALKAVARCDPEAWAVGQRNGQDVPSTDETYENNSKYYANRAASDISSGVDAANAAAARAEAAVPAGTAGAVFFDRAQSLTDAQKEQARANIRSGVYNKNLLNNPCWTSADAINQRGVTSWSGLVASKYTIDRWRLTSESLGNSVTLGSNGMTLSIQDGYPASIFFMQYIDNFNAISGLTVTGSVKLSNGTIYSGSGSGNASFYYNNGLHFGVTSSGYFYVELYTERSGQSSVTYTIQSVKLELGSYSTLANDTPPDRGVELAKCISSNADPNDPYANSGYARSNRNLLDNPFFTVNQRGSATYTLTGNAYIVDRWKSSSGNTITVSSNGISMASASNTHQNLIQGIDSNVFTSLFGKVVTVSVLTQAGALSTLTFTMPSSITSGTNYNAGTMTIGGASFIVYLPNSSSGLPSGYSLWLYSTTTGATIAYKAVKLELGSYSTLINDTPPDYGEELRKCQRYFVRYSASGAVLGLGVAYAHSTTDATGIITLPCPMRTTPSIATTGTIALQQGTVRYNLTSPSVSGITNNVLILTSPYTVGTGTATAGTTGGLLLRENSSVSLSADL